MTALVESKRRRVIVESPYRGDRELNLAYLRAAMRDCLLRNEAPFASHGLYAQPGVLDDGIPEQRRNGIEAGFAWGEVADATVVYTDLGVTDGMREGMRHALRAGRPIEHRILPGWKGRLDAIDSRSPPIQRALRDCTAHCRHPGR
jgi:hypothetical protein